MVNPAELDKTLYSSNEKIDLPSNSPPTGYCSDVSDKGSKPLWTPEPLVADQTNMARFISFLNRKEKLHLKNFDDLYDWSISNIPQFWESVWGFVKIKSSQPYKAVLEKPLMPGAVWFRGARLNYAENLLRFADNKKALTFVREGGEVVSSLTYADLYFQVAAMAGFLRKVGVVQGERVAGFMPNRIESVVMMLAAASIGAIWSSCSPDFGFKGVMDRFGQIEPKILLTADGYYYNGKTISSLEKAAQVVAAVPSIEKVVVVPFISDRPQLQDFGKKAVLWEQALVDNEAGEIQFAQLPFDHPLYIMYSSGTTGVPKCMVHGAGGTLIQHAKELILHCDLSRKDTIFYFTTCGWMMWNWLVSSLFAGAHIVLYDGSPVWPDTDVLWKMSDELGITVFGTSAKYIALCMKSGVSVKKQYDLSRLRAVLSTGSPLSVDGFQWVYQHVKEDLQLASICGGTDLISCFVLGDPTSPVYAGEIQKRGLGMKVEAWSDDGEALVEQKGELVCTAPFPSMPVRFWNDPDNQKYYKAYFNHFPGVWHHGDYIEITARGGVIVHGRSDATLNPSGVRLGSAEIYQHVEAMAEIEDSLVVGQNWQNDVRVVLFVVLRLGLVLTEELIRKIRNQIRYNTSPHHVPAKIIAVPEIPMTINGKKVEMAVLKIIEGQEVKNKDALINPDALEYFNNLAELQK